MIDPSDYLPEPTAPRATSIVAASARLLTYECACAYLGGISEGTLRNLVKAGELNPIRLLRTVRFDRIDLDLWIESQKKDALRIRNI